MAAQIVINDGTNPPVIGSSDEPSTFLNVAHTLSNFDNSGVLAWRWTLVDRPIGSAAALTSTTASTPQLTPDVPGTYLIELRTYSDAGATALDDQDQRFLAIRFAGAFDWRIPAATETTEGDANRGWATAREEAIRDVQTYLTGGLQAAYAQQRTIDLSAGAVVLTRPSGAAELALGADATGGRGLRIYETPSGQELAAVADTGVLFTRDVTGLTELFYRRSDGAISQLSGLPSTTLQNAYEGGNTISISSGEGSIDITPSDTTSPIRIRDSVPATLMEITSTGRVRAAPGSTAEPGVSFVGASTYGFNYYSGRVAFVTAGAEIGWWDSSGFALSSTKTLRLGVNNGPLGIQGTIQQTVAGGSIELRSGQLAATTALQQTFVKVTGEVNQTGGAASSYVGIMVDATETALGTGSNRLLSLRTGGTARFDVDNTGRVLAGDGTLAAPAYAFVSEPGSGMFRLSANSIRFGVAGATALILSNTYVGVTTHPITQASNAWPLVLQGSTQNGGLGGGISDGIRLNTGTHQSTQATVFEQRGLVINATVDQSGAAAGSSFIAIMMNITETAYGTGTNRWISLRGGNVERWAMTKDAYTLAPDGALGTPSYAFLNDATSGLYRITGGFRATSSSVTIADFAIASSQPQLRIAGGSAAVPSFAFIPATTTGIFRTATPGMGFATGGTQRLEIADAAVTLAVQLRSVDGALATPGVAFTGDASSGFYRITGGFAAGVAGSLVAEFVLNGSLTQMRIGNGSATVPSLSFASASTTGAYKTTSGLGFTISGTQIADFLSTQMQIRNTNSTSAPPYSFLGDTDTGLTSSFADNINLVTGGAARISANSTTVTIQPTETVFSNDNFVRIQGRDQTVAGTAGKAMTIRGGAGSPGSSGVAGAAGAPMTIHAGNGGDKSTGTGPGNGGKLTVHSGTGGSAVEGAGASGSAVFGVPFSAVDATTAHGNVLILAGSEPILTFNRAIVLWAPYGEFYYYEKGAERIQGEVSTSGNQIQTVAFFYPNTTSTSQIRVQVVGYSAGDEVVSYYIVGTFRYTGTTLTQVGSTTTIHSHEDAGLTAASVAFVINTSTVEINVTGVTGQTIDWRARGEAVWVG